MIPGHYDLEMYQGDPYSIRFQLPNLTGHDGPVDLVGATVAAQIRNSVTSASPSATFTVVIENGAERRVRLTLTKIQTTALIRSGVWDLEVTAPDGWNGTVIEGEVKVIKQVTR